MEDIIELFGTGTSSSNNEDMDRIGTIRDLSVLKKTLPFIKGKPRVVKEVAGIRIKMSSLRYDTFLYKGTTCVSCGLEANTLYVERSREAEERGAQYIMNLYWVDPSGTRDEVIFTKDHIIPKSHGGADTLENLQTMCFDCNQEKGNTVSDRDLLLVMSNMLKNKR